MWSLGHLPATKQPLNSGEYFTCTEEIEMKTHWEWQIPSWMSQDVSMVTEVLTLPFNPPLSSPPPLSPPLTFVFLSGTEDSSESKEALSSTGFMITLMIYLTETNGVRERDTWREVKEERERGKLDLNSCKNSHFGFEKRGYFNHIALMFQPLAHKRPNFSQFLWVIPLNWRTIGFDWTHALLPPSQNPLHPLSPSCQSLSPQFTPLMQLHRLFPCTTPLPTSLSIQLPRQPVWQIWRWDTWHWFKRETRMRLDMWEEVSGNDCPRRHT